MREEEEEVGERNMREESGDLVIRSDLQQKKNSFFFLIHPSRGPFKEK